MTEWKNRLLGRPVTFLQNQRGITGLETAIVLIAFVVLDTGLLSSKKSKEATLGGLEETSATLSLRGQVIAVANTGTVSTDVVKFTRDGLYRSETVDLSNTGTVITYLDENQGINRGNPQSFDGDADTAECSWSSSWLIGSGDIVDPGEQVEITVTLTDLTPLLAEKIEFTVQVKPNKGAAVMVNRVMPGELMGVMELN